MDNQGDYNDADPENIPDTPTSLPKMNQAIQPSLTTFDPKTSTVQPEPEVIHKQLEESEEILDEEQQEMLQNGGNTSMVESQKSFGLGGIQEEDAYEMEEEEEYSIADSQQDDDDEEEEEEKEVVPDIMADDMDAGDGKLDTSKQEEVKNDIPQEEYDYLNVDFDDVEEPKGPGDATNVQDDGIGGFGDLNSIVVDIDGGKDKDKKKGKDKGDKDKGDKDKKGKDKNQSAEKLKGKDKEDKKDKKKGKDGKDKDQKDAKDAKETKDADKKEPEGAKTEGADEITTLKKPEDGEKQANGEIKEGEEANQGAIQEAAKDKKEKDADQKSEGKKSDKSKAQVKNIVPSNIGFKDMAAYREGYLKQKLAQDKINAAVRKRKIMRYIYYFLLLGIIAAVITLAVIFQNMTGTIRYDANKDIKITGDNCTINIYDYNGAGSSPIILEYKVPRGLDVEDGGSSVSHDSDTNPAVLDVKNAFGKYVYRCVVDIFVREGTQLGDLTLDCKRCRLTQDSATLKVGTITLKGNEINATFSDVSAEKINFEATIGYLQLSHVITTAESTIKMISGGDIVIQSTKDMNIEGKTDTQAFCFSAPKTTKTSAADCYLADDDATKTNKDKTTCAPKYTLCKTGTCSSAQKFTVESVQGNIYANLIPGVGKNIVADDYEIKYGQTYDRGIRMSTDAAEKISNFSQQAQDSSVNSPMIILDLGNYQSRSAQYMKWVITANPAYAYMKPWWMSVFSATILTNYQEKVSGALLPGFCPYYPVYNIENMDLIQFELLKNASYEYAIATFVVDQDGLTPSLVHPTSNGIFKYSESRAPADYWYSVIQNQDGKTYTLLDNNINQKLIILFAIILSLIIALYVTFLLTEIFTIGVNVMYYKVVNFANHLESYSVLQKKKVDIAVEEALKVEEKKEESVKDKKKRKIAEKKKKSSKEIKYNFANIMRSAPSLSAFIDYLCLILYRQFSNSVDQFYRLLFVETTSRDDEAPDPDKDAIKGTEAKLLYEKFCFMNHLVEQRLTDELNLKILRKYGFDIVSRTDLLSEVFTRVNIKKHDNFLVQANDTSDTLKLYIENNVEITAFEEDQVEVDYFIKLYYNFCDYNRLPKVLVSPTLMKDVFGVETKNVPQQFIMVKKDEEDFKTPPKSIVERVKAWLERRQREKVYKIDITRLQDHFDLRLRKPLPLDRLQAATIESITYKGWWIWDFITVVLHMTVTLILSVPLLVLVIVMETQYSPFSMKDPSILIQPSDFTRDFGNLVEKLFMTFGWNIAVVVIVCVFWFISFIDIIIYYSVMDFPQDKSFVKSEDMKSESALLRFSRRLEWILIFAALMFYFGYIGLLLVWLLLGAIINPNAFLPFTSAAATFVAFCKSKYTEFKNLSKDGTKKIKEFLDKIFGGTISKVLGKITQSLSAAAGYVANKGKSLLKSDAFKMVSGKLAESGVIDAATLESYTRKVETLDPKAVMAGAAALARDPMIIQREMEKLAAELKDKAIKKVKSECTKRGIPEDLVDLILAVSLKQEDNIKTSLRGLLQKISYRVYFPQDSIDIVIEFLYPKSVNKEETVQYILEKIINIMYNQLYLGYYVPGLTPEILVQFFTNFKKLRDLNFEEFIMGLKGIMEKVPNFRDMKEVNAFLPVLDIIAVMAREKPNWTKLKEPSMVLLSGAIKFFYSKQHEKEIKDREEKSRKEKEDKERKGIQVEETEEQRKERLQKEEEQRLADIKNQNKDEMIDDFVKFLRVISAGQETLIQTDSQNQDGDSEKKTVDTKEIIKMFAKFLGHLGVKEAELGGKKEYGERTIPSLLVLLLGVAKGELHDIPNDVYHEVEKMLGLSSYLNKNEIVSFAFNLIHCINTKPRDIFPRLSQSLGAYGWPSDIQDFIKIITCYPLEEWEQFCSSINIQENYYFLQIAKAMNIESKEFLGLINMIYRKRIDTSDDFLKLVLTRMNVKLDKLKPIKSILELLLSEEEHTLLRAIKNLDLEDSHFLLMGKFVFNPLFIPKSEFEKLGIDKDNQRGKIFNGTPEEFEIWKTGLKKEMGDWVNAKKREIEKERKDTYDKVASQKRADELQKELDEYETQRAYLNIYLCDWKAQIYTKKNVLSIINALDNPYNNLKKALGADEGTLLTGVDCLYTILNIKDLLVEANSRYEKLDKEKKNAIREFANIFNIKEDILERALAIFVVSDPNEVINNFVEFFPAQKKNLTQLIKAYSYGQKVMDGLKQVNNFISKKFPEAIELPDASLNIPAGLIKKLFWGTKNISNQDLLDLLQLALKKVFPKDSERESIIFNCYYIGLFAKGQLGDSTLKGILNIKKTEYLKVFRLFTLKDDNERLSLLSELFTDHEHPIKYFLAFYGLLTKKEFDIVTVKKIKAGSGKNKIDTTETKKYTPKEFISKKFGIHQELLDLLEVVYERDISKFIQQALRIVRRIQGDSFVDTNMLETIFALSIGEHFNPTYLANKLGVTPETIEFLMSLLRLSSENLRKREIARVTNSIPFKNVCSKLKIVYPEFEAMFKLLFNLFDDNSISDLVRRLELQDKINIEKLSGLMAINMQLDYNQGIVENKAIADKTKVKTEKFFEELDLNVDYGFLISRLVAGDLLTLRHNRQFLDWIFPCDDPKAEEAIRSLTFGICGLLNTKTGIPKDLNNATRTFYNAFYPKKNNKNKEAKFVINEPEPSGTGGVVPNNSLAYSIYLTHLTLDIAPTWTQLFLFDEKTFDSVCNDKALTMVSKEYLVSLVLCWINVPDCSRDAFGIHEWTLNNIKYYEEKTGNKKEPNFKKQDFHNFYVRRFAFTAEGMTELAIKTGLKDTPSIMKLFEDPKKYNVNVNTSLLYFLLLKDKNLRREVGPKITSKYLELPPPEFLTKAILIILNNETMKDDAAAGLVGEYMESVIVRTYKAIHRRFYGQLRLPGFAMTNFCILGTISLLRSSDKSDMDYTRLLYNLNQVWANIEKKLYLQDEFMKMSRITLIKISGICLGWQLSNLIEFSLPPNLIPNSFLVDVYTQTESKEARGLSPEEKAQKIVDLRVKELENKCLNYYSYDFIFSDAGYYNGNWSEFSYSYSRMLTAEDWEFTIVYFNLKDKYLGDPDGQFALSKDRAQWNYFYKKCELPEETPLEHRDKVFMSKSILLLIYDSYYAGMINHTEERLKLKNEKEYKKYDPNAEPPQQKMAAPEAKEGEKKIELIKKVETEEEKQLAYYCEQLVDIRTGLHYSVLESKSYQFEVALMSPNTNLIIGIIHGETDVLLKKDNAIGQSVSKDPLAPRIYRALLGLQSYNKLVKKDKKLLKEYLSVISNERGSDMSRIEELLNFFMTRKIALNEVFSTLEISNERMIDLLFMNIKLSNSKANDDDDDIIMEDEQEAFDLPKVLQNVLNLDENEIKMFELLRDVYLVRKEGWLRCVSRLIKRNEDSSEDEEDEEDEEEEEENSKKSLLARKKTMAIKIKFPDAIKNNPLFKLINLIDFKGLKNDIIQNKSKSMFDYIKSTKNPGASVISIIFEEIILELKYFKENLEETKRASLIRLFNAMEGIFKHKFDSLFKDFIQPEFEIPPSIKYPDLATPTKLPSAQPATQPNVDPNAQPNEQPNPNPDPNAQPSNPQGQPGDAQPVQVQPTSPNAKPEEKKKEEKPAPAPKKGKKGQVEEVDDDKCNIGKTGLLEDLFTLFGVDVHTKSYASIKRIISLFFTFCHEDLAGLKKNPVMKNVLQNLIHEISQTEFISFLKNKEDRRRISQLLLGILTWDLETLLNAFLSENTLQEAYLLANLYCVTKLHKMFKNAKDFGPVIENCIGCVFSIVAKRLSNKNAVKTLFEYNGSFTSLFNTELSGETDKKAQVVAIQKKIRNLFQQIEKSEQPKVDDRGKTINPASFFRLIANSFQDTNQRFSYYSSQPLQHIIEIVKSIGDGSAIVKVMNRVRDNNSAFAKPLDLAFAIVKFLLPFIEKFFTPEGKSPENQARISSEIDSGLTGLLECIKKYSQDKIWTPISKIAPGVMKMYLAFQSTSKGSSATLKVKVLTVIMGLFKSIEDESQKELIIDIMSMVIGTNLRTWYEKAVPKTKDEKPQDVKITVDLSPSDRLRIFFNRIVLKFFPQLQYYIKGDKFEKLFDLTTKLTNDFLRNMKDPQKVRDIFISIIPILSDFNIVHKSIGKPLIMILEGKLESDSEEVIMYLIPDGKKDTAKKSIKYLKQVRELLSGNFETLNNIQLPISLGGGSGPDETNTDEWAEIMKKIKEGTASTKDLFSAVDKAGDGSGSINEEEFLMLAKRLGLQLSTHRVKEIFAKVKGKKVKDGQQSLELNEKEFSKALDYLNGKNLMQALTQLGITPEILTAILIRLIILLLLIFVFIFLGISSFALGGTFGAIINSMFPAAGGGALGKKSDADKEKLNNENVENAAENSININTTQNL